MPCEKEKEGFRRRLFLEFWMKVSVSAMGTSAEAVGLRRYGDLSR
jgi:hypothetical protein